MTGEIGIERPPGYSDEEWEAYQKGAQRMLELAGSFLLTMAGDVDGQSMPPPDAADGADADEEEYPDTCECGMELVYEMGEDEPTCPNCDLL